ncbi:MAG: DNA polymerase II large subunit, partial [Nanoarchaeota archaeon]
HLSDKIRAVDADDVARIVIETHFLKDINGNLRRYGQQKFRCTSCNTTYRRPPLLGACPCGGKLVLTVTEGSVLKYMKPSLELARQYRLPEYLMDTLHILEMQVSDVFGLVTEKQMTLK